MVTVIGFNKRKNKNDEEFFVLELQGEVEMLRAVNTGKFYAHARKATITTTVNEATCKALINTKFPGKIVKMDCEEYSYTVLGTNDIITLSHNYQFIGENTNVEETVFSGGIS